MHGEMAGGHFATVTTVQKILDAGHWWPTLLRDVHQFVLACDPCQRAGGPRAAMRHPLHPVIPLAPFEKWGIDYIGPFS